MLILVFLALNNAAPSYNNNNNNFIYIAKIDQLNLNIKTAGINLCELIKYLKLVLAIKKDYQKLKGKIWLQKITAIYIYICI